MDEGLWIEVVDPDGDYLGIEIRASNGRFAGYAWIYSRLEELSDFALYVEGFPSGYEDQRAFEFGSQNPSMAGGYCSLKFRCLDRTGHFLVDVFLDGKRNTAPESARFSFKAEPAALDRFVERLRVVQRERVGTATLHADTVA